MKLTKTQLKQLIKEEVNNLIEVEESWEASPWYLQDREKQRSRRLSDLDVGGEVAKNAVSILRDLIKFIEEGNPTPEDIDDIESVMVELGNKILPY